MYNYNHFYFPLFVYLGFLTLATFYKYPLCVFFFFFFLNLPEDLRPPYCSVFTNVRGYKNSIVHNNFRRHLFPSLALLYGYLIVLFCTLYGIKTDRVG